jgi:hypothetical protein
MTDFFSSETMPWLAGALVVVLLAMVWFFVGRPRTRLEQIINDISFDRVRNLVLPNADGGEILIDQLLLTSQGLLILEIKDVQGTVFGSDKMQDWTVIAPSRRFTFPNPQPGLYDRIAAVREVVRDVPVTGRILFMDGAEFPKGVPGLVSGLDELLAEFGEKDPGTARVKVDSFMPQWERLKQRWLSGGRA